MTDPEQMVAETLRGRVLRGLQAGTLEPGERLPSARELVGEFGVDHRLILAAYRELAKEGLVEIRERGGVYVGASEATGTLTRALPVAWIVDTFAAAHAREVTGPLLPELIRRAVETVRLRALVVTTTADQVAGLARELSDDFGLLADGLLMSESADAPTLAQATNRCDVIIATEGAMELASTLAAKHDKPVIRIEVRPDLVAGEWAILLRQPVWAIVATPEFGEMLERFFADVKGIENLHVLVHGRDNLANIPRDAPTYVTQRVRDALGDTPIPGRVLPPARSISSDSARLIFDFIVRANVRAKEAVQRGRR